MVVNAPLAGNIFRIEKNIGDTVSEDETIIVLEAMKMETTIKTPASGKIKQIFIKNGDKVSLEFDISKAHTFDQITTKRID